MFKRFLMALVAAFTIGTGVVALAPPASASSYQLCGDGWICFYNYTNHNTAGGVWGKRIYDNYGNCNTMPTSGTSFTNGTAYNAATSIVVNNTPNPNALEIYVRYYDGNDCFSGELMLTQQVYPGLDISKTNLANIASFPWGGGTVNDRIGSYMINSSF